MGVGAEAVDWVGRVSEGQDMHEPSLSTETSDSKLKRRVRGVCELLSRSIDNVRVVPPPTFVSLSATMSSFYDPARADRPYKDPTPLPESVPKVQELGATSAPLKSAAFFIGAHCKEYNGEFTVHFCVIYLFIPYVLCFLALAR